MKWPNRGGGGYGGNGLSGYGGASSRRPASQCPPPSYEDRAVTEWARRRGTRPTRREVLILADEMRRTDWNAEATSRTVPGTEIPLCWNHSLFCDKSGNVFVHDRARNTPEGAVFLYHVGARTWVTCDVEVALQRFTPIEKHPCGKYAVAEAAEWRNIKALRGMARAHPLWKYGQY